MSEEFRKVRSLFSSFTGVSLSLSDEIWRFATSHHPQPPSTAPGWREIGPRERRVPDLRTGAGTGTAPTPADPSEHVRGTRHKYTLKLESNCVNLEAPVFVG